MVFSAADIQCKIDQALNDPTKLNNIVDLIELLDDADDFVDDNVDKTGSERDPIQLLEKISQGLLSVFSRYLPQYQRTLKEKSFRDSATITVANWFMELFHEYKKILCRFVMDRLEDNFVKMYMCLMVAECNSVVGNAQATCLNSMVAFVKSYLRNERRCSSSIGDDILARDYLSKHNDVQWLILKAIASLYSDGKVLESSGGSESFHLNCFHLLEKCVDWDTPTPLFSARWRHQPHRQQLKRAYSSAWLRFLQVSMPFDLLVMVYNRLHVDVIPRLYHPKLLADFLLQSMDCGGALGLLCLPSMFTLVTQHNLECELYYEKLYKLLPVAINFQVAFDGPEFKKWWYTDCTHSGRRAFWTVLQASLSSTYIPAYVAASFCKRLARLAVTSAQIDDTILCVITVGKVLATHEPVRFLLHRKQTTSGVSSTFQNDPFDMASHSLKANGAMKSCLWELVTLRNHYCPEVVETVDSLLEDTEQAWKWRRVHFEVPTPLTNINYSGLLQLLVVTSDSKIPINANITDPSLKLP